VPAVRAAYARFRHSPSYVPGVRQQSHRHRAGTPLTRLGPDVIDPVAHYGAELVLVRPDQHIAWLGDAVSPADAETVLRQAVAGFGAS
jgi:hypothetical protein